MDLTRCDRCGADFEPTDLEQQACRYCGKVLPHRARAAERAEIARQLLADENRDGIPDALEGLVAAAQGSPTTAATSQAVEAPGTAPKKKKKKKKKKEQQRGQTEVERVLDELEQPSFQEPEARDAMGRPYDAFNKPLSGRAFWPGFWIGLFVIAFAILLISVAILGP